MLNQIPMVMGTSKGLWLGFQRSLGWTYLEYDDGFLVLPLTTNMREALPNFVPLKQRGFCRASETVLCQIAPTGELQASSGSRSQLELDRFKRLGGTVRRFQHPRNPLGLWAVGVMDQEAPSDVVATPGPIFQVSGEIEPLGPNHEVTGTKFLRLWHHSLP